MFWNLFQLILWAVSVLYQYKYMCCIFRGTKIVLKGENSAHLFDVEDLAQKAHIPHYLVHDAGKTQVHTLLKWHQLENHVVQFTCNNPCLCCVYHVMDACGMGNWESTRHM